MCSSCCPMVSVCFLLVVMAVADCGFADSCLLFIADSLCFVVIVGCRLCMPVVYNLI